MSYGRPGVMRLHREIARAEFRAKQPRRERTIEEVVASRRWKMGRVSLHGLLFGGPYKSDYKKPKRRHQRDCSRNWR